MFLRKYLLILTASAFLLGGCLGSGSSSNGQTSNSTATTPTTPISTITYITIPELDNSPTFQTNFFQFTAYRNSSHNYTSFQYSLDNQISFTPGEFNNPVTLHIPADGQHYLYVKGVWSNGSADPVKKYPFTVTSLAHVADGKHFGDSIVFYNNYNNMRLKFVSYSGARTADTLSGKLSVDGEGTYNLSNPYSSVNAVGKPYEYVQLRFEGTSSASHLDTFGVGYYDRMSLYFGGTDNVNVPTLGDMRLYRESIGKTMVASASAVHGTNINPSNTAIIPDIQIVLTLYTYDNRHYYGHIRFIDPFQGKIFTYDVTSDAGSGGFSSANNGLYLTFSNLVGYYWPTRSSYWPQYVTQYNYVNYNAINSMGSVVVDLDQNGFCQIKELSIIISGYAAYTAAPSNITMVKTYAFP